MALTATDRRILRLALPAGGALAAEPLFRLVDTAIVGRLGTEQLGGVAVAVAILTIVIGGSNFLAYGTTQRVANRLGAGNPSGAADVAVQAFWLAGIIGAIAAPPLIVLAEPLASVLGAQGEVLASAVTYLRISACGVPFVLVVLAAQGTQRGASDYRSPLIVLVASNVVNVVLEIVFVFGFGMGVAGAAWSTVIAQVLAAGALWRLTQPFTVAARTWRPRRSEMAPLLSAGRHLLLRVGSMLAVFTGATAVAARVDDPTLAAYSITMTMFSFLALTLDALAIPAQTLVAEELGKGGPGSIDVAQRSARLSLRIGVGLAVLLGVCAPAIARWFTTDAEVISRATAGLWLLAGMMIPGSLAFSTDGSLIGAGDYRFLGRAALAYLVAVTPIAAVVLAFPALGIVGIWGGLLVWMTLRAVVNVRRSQYVLGPA